MMAQAIRAILLASATAATFVGSAVSPFVAPVVALNGRADSLDVVRRLG
jgi:hypothetical protein